MKTRRIIAMATLVFGSALCLATDDEGEILLADLSGMQLSLDGAPHYYLLTPEKGRVVLNRECVPIDKDCDHHVLVVWDEGGQIVFERAPHLDIPEMSGDAPIAATLLTPQRLVLSTVSPSWALAGYDINKDELSYVVPTDPIRCQDLLGDDQGTIWCLGDDYAQRANDEDFDLVYRFDHGGKLLGSTLPRSSFPRDPHPLSKIKIRSGFGGFLPGDGEVRLWLPAVGELITFDTEGEVLDRLVLPNIEGQVRAWLVTAPDKDIFGLLVSGTDVDDHRTYTQALYKLASDGASWIPLQDPPIRLPMRIKLAGADESGLILLDRKSLELLWYPIETKAE